MLHSIDGGILACQATADVGEPTLLAAAVTPAREAWRRRTVLRDAENSCWKQIDAKVSGAADVLAAMYGSEVTAGKDDAVMELDVVRGSRVTTLLSTLLSPHDSHDSTRINWATTEHDVGNQGRGE